MTDHSLISLACRITHTTPRQVTEKKQYQVNVNLRALVIYLLTKYARMHPILIGELIGIERVNIANTIKRIAELDNQRNILEPGDVRMLDLIDEAEKEIINIR